MNRIIAFTFMLAVAVYVFASKNALATFLFNFQDELTVVIGPDTTLCQTGARIDFRPVVSDPDLFQVRWEPGALVNDSTQLNTFGSFNEPAKLRIRVSTISDTELIFNGDFSQGNTGFTTDYQVGTSSSNIGILAEPNTYAITTNPRSVNRRFAACTNHAGTPQIMVANGSDLANKVWCQEVTVEPNQDYVFSAWLASMSTQNPARLQFSINDIPLGDELQAAETTCLWRQFFATWNSGASTQAEICIVNINRNVAGNDFALDDISFRPLLVAHDTIQIDVAMLDPTWSGPSQFCSDGAAITLNTLLAPNATPNGVWTLDGIPLTTLDPAAVSPGDHQLKYSVQQSQCVENLEQTIRILEVRSAGAPLETAKFCTPATGIIQLIDRLQGADPGGTWTEISAAPSSGNAFNAAQGTFNLAGIAPGAYTFRYTQSAPAGCNSSQVEVTIQIDPAPVADAGANMSLDCTLDMLSIGGSNTSSGPQFRYQWSAINGSRIETPNEALTEITRADAYVLRVENTGTGCFATDTVVITAQQTPPKIFARSVNINCPGGGDGRIIVDSISHGRPPYRLSLNGQSINIDQPVGGLAPGKYLLAVEDANGCTDNVQFDLTDPISPTLSLLQQTVGDSIALRIETNLSLSEIAEIIWSPLNLNCPQCLNTSIPIPKEDTEFAVTVTDRKGCTYQAQITIAGQAPAQQAEYLYIPNAFSPNEDGNNDFFTIFSAKGQATNIKMMHIADRWGNLLFSKQNFPPDEPTAGWDGIYNGRRLNPGVFIYVAEVEMADGTSIVVQGDILLLH